MGVFQRSVISVGTILVFLFLAKPLLYAQKADELNKTSEAIINEDPDKSLELGRKALKNATESKDQKQEAYAYYNIGTAQFYLDQYNEAIKTVTKGLKLSQSIGERLIEGKCESMIGEIHVYTAEYSKSLEHLSSARKIFEEINATVELARCNNLMGIIHKNQYNYDEALVYFKKAFELGDDIRKGDACLSMGQVYYAQKLFAEADQSLNKAVVYARKNKDNYVLADALVALGQVNLAYGKREEAFKFLQEAMVIKEEVDDQQGIAIVCNTMGTLYLQTNNAKEAHKLFLRSVNIASKIDTREELKDAYLGLSNTFHLKGVDDSAYLFLDQYNKINQAILSEEASKKLSQIEDALVEEKAKQEQERKEFQNRVLFWVGVGFILILLIFAYIMYNRYKLKQKANIEITRQKDEIEKQKNHVEEQKKIIEEKNHEITDSINYAKRIQQAVLPSESEFIGAFKDAFVLFKPKDIVSGDFFWFTKVKSGSQNRRFDSNREVQEEKELIIYATADCTGHGVPGGFMSMLGTSLLNEIINEGRVYDPGKALDFLRDKVIAGLKQTGAAGENKDGMDIVLTVFDLDSRKLNYAAANNGFYILRNGQLISLNPDKQPIGHYADAMKPFTTNQLDLQPGDCVYTFTDGYADQFGGPRGKKLKYKTMEQKLLEIHQLPMTQQREIMNTMIVDWMGDLEQNDDVCLIGVRIA